MCACRTTYLIERLLPFYNRQEPPMKGRYCCRRRLLRVSYATRRANRTRSRCNQVLLGTRYTQTYIRVRKTTAVTSAAAAAATAAAAAAGFSSNKHTTLTLDNALSRQSFLNLPPHPSSSILFSLHRFIICGLTPPQPVVS